MIRRLLAVFLTAVILGGCSGEDATPTLSFDGEAATYSGPDTL
jgi:PBP1b-binding outer membrane lipoprotein LpoB